MSETQKKYWQTEKGKEVVKRAKKRYSQTEKGKEVQSKYFKSEKGKEAIKKSIQKRRAIKLGIEAEDINSIEIFERCNWTCGICGKTVDKNLKHPEHFSASLDHIVPLSKGGKHISENVQCAHLICNIRKGNRT